MRRKNLVYLIAALVLLAVAVWLYYQQTTAKLSFKEDQLFEFDTSKVTYIAFDFGDKQIELEKIKGIWMVNEKFNLDPKKFEALYQAHRRLSFRSPASEPLAEQLEGLPDNKKIKIHMTVGGKEREFNMVYDSLGGTGTYVTIPGSEKYFQVFLPGYKRSDLTDLYPENLTFWRNRTLIALKTSEIKGVSVIYPQRPAASFSLSIVNSSVRIENSISTLPEENINQENVHQYLGYFAHVEVESILDTLSNKEVTNIVNEQPEAIITVTTTADEVVIMEVFNKMLVSGGSQIDPNFVYVKRNDIEGVMLASFVEIATLLKRIDYFRRG